MTDRISFRRVNEITGTFVLIIVALIVAGVIWTGRSQRWFKSNVSLRIELPADGAAGIRQGSEVYFLGTLVGTVSDVQVDAAGRMEAQARIRRDFFRFVRKDSSAVVKKKFGVAGDSYFEISRVVGKPLAERNALIVCKEQFQSALESAIDEIRVQALLVLKKSGESLDTWKKLGADLDESRQHAEQVINHLEKITSEIEQGKGTVGKLISDTTLADEARLLLRQAVGAVTEFQTVATNLDVAARNVQIGTERLPELVGTVTDGARELPGLFIQTETSMREVERLVEGMQRHWLLRRYMNKTNPPPARVKPVTPAPIRK
jgi:phospholipid/cholesterol/gamma-HCH transport system substrate-binding protein